MKHTLILLASGVVVAGSLAFSVNVHRSTVQHQLIVDAKATASRIELAAKQKAAAIQVANQTQAEIDQLKAQCQAGLLDYNLLTAYQKVHAVKPVCSL